MKKEIKYINYEFYNYNLLYIIVRQGNLYTII